MSKLHDFKNDELSTTEQESTQGEWGFKGRSFGKKGFGKSRGFGKKGFGKSRGFGKKGFGKSRGFGKKG